MARRPVRREPSCSFATTAAFSAHLAAGETDARARADGLQALASGQTGLLTYHLDPEGGESVGSCGATLEIFVEPVRPEPRLILAGSGYVAQALTRLATAIGWRVSLLDDRSEFVQSAALPDIVTLTSAISPNCSPRSRPTR